MMKYRKKPVEIEAVRFMMDEPLPDWFMDAMTAKIITTCSDGDCFINTLEGTMHAPHGHYIIRGVRGEIYACEPEIFAETYEKVD
jgi:hypothetical protein